MELYDACKNGKIEEVRILLAGGANPDSCNNDASHTTSLIAAAEEGHTAIVETLLEHGANPNLTYIRNSDPPKIETSLWAGRAPPLICATSRGSIEMAKLLLKYDANPNLCCPYGMSPLITVLRCSFYLEEQIVLTLTQLLLDYGADPNSSDYYCNPVLKWTANRSNSSVALLLIKYGADPRVLEMEYDGEQLLKAVSRNNATMVRILLYWQSRPIVSPDTTNREILALFAAEQKYRSTRRYDHHYSTILMCDPASAKMIALLYLIYQRPSTLALLPVEMFVEIVKWAIHYHPSIPAL